MKKNIPPLCLALSLTALALSQSAFAQDNTTPENGSPPSAQNGTGSTQNGTGTTAKKDATKRAEPTPQANRIRALEADLQQHQLSHQINILNADNTPFLTLYRNSLTKSLQGCAILLPADNGHPNWPTVIGPLRNALPHFSWCTISVEIPDINKRAQAITPSANQPEGGNTPLPNQQIIFDRIQAVIADAKSKGATQFVFIGYHTGAAYALAYLANNTTAGTALALIDTESPRRANEYTLAQQIRKVNVPILDYYYGRSMEKKRFALWRKQAANQRQEDETYMQLDAIPETRGARDGKRILIQYVRGFIKQNTSQIDQTKPLPEYKKGLFYKSPIDDTDKDDE